MLHCSSSGQQRQRPALIGRRYAFVYLLVGAFLYLAACAAPAAPAAQPTAAATAALPASDEGNAVAPPSPLSLPDPTTFSNLRDRLVEVVTAPTGFQVKVVVPPAVLEKDGYRLADLLLALQDTGLELLNREIFDRPPDELLNLSQPTTFTRLDSGAQYQIIWLNPVEVVDPWLAQFQNWTTEWLLVGFTAIYQEQSFEEIGTIKPGLHAVLLGNDNGTPIFQLFSIDGFADKGIWTLRELPEEQKSPFTFITAREHCFSYQKYQACLNLVPFFGADQQELILMAVDELKSKNLLPADYEANDKFAFVSVSGQEAVKLCEEAISAGESENCHPNVVLAAAPTYGELVEGVVKSDRPEFDQTRIDAPSDVSAVVWGIGVGIVGDIVPGPLVTDEAQGEVNLPPGLYRFDLLFTEGGITQIEFRDRETPVQLVQLVGSNSARYYDPVLELPPVEGRRITPSEGRNIEGNEIMLSTNIFAWCGSSSDGNGPCPTNASLFLSDYYWCSR